MAAFEQAAGGSSRRRRGAARRQRGSRRSRDHAGIGRRRARSPRASPRSSSVIDRLRAVPAGAGSARSSSCSFVLRAWLARGMLGPVHHGRRARLLRARRRASRRRVSLRSQRVPTRGYGIVYPVLIAPAYALFERLPDAYAAVKTINSLGHVARGDSRLPPRPQSHRHVPCAPRRRCSRSRSRRWSTRRP